MRWLMSLAIALALSVIGCSETSGAGGSGGDGGLTDVIEQMMVGRWWLDWDSSDALTTSDGAGLATFTDEGWANYDVEFPNINPPIPDWCRRYAEWSLFDVVSETEFGYALTYTHDTCNREAGQVEQFKVVLDQMDPPKGEVTRLSADYPAAAGDYSLPIERCTTDTDATEACGFETGLGPPTQNPGTGGSGGSGGDGGAGGAGGSGGSVGNNPPVIDYVEWEYGGDCTGIGPTTLRVTVSASDADDPTGETLTYAGSLMYCDAFSVSAASPVTQTVDCDLFQGLEFLDVKVTDPQQNEDTISATFESATCESGCVENDEGQVGCP